jgi:hypothetical protein
LRQAMMGQRRPMALHQPVESRYCVLVTLEEGERSG